MAGDDQARACRSRTARRRRRRTPAAPRAARSPGASPSTVTTSRPVAPARRARGRRTRARRRGDRARAALALLAGVLGAGQAEPLAQHVEQALADPRAVDRRARSPLTFSSHAVIASAQRPGRASGARARRPRGGGRRRCRGRRRSAARPRRPARRSGRARRRRAAPGRQPVLVELAGDERLGLGGAQRRRPDRADARRARGAPPATSARRRRRRRSPSRCASRPWRTPAGPAAAGSVNATISSSGGERRALRAGHELGDRHAAACRARRRELDDGVRARRAAAARRRRATRWRGCRRPCRGCGSAASRPCGWRSRGPGSRSPSSAMMPRVGDAGADRAAARPRGAQLGQLGHAREVEHRRRGRARSKLSSTIRSVPPASAAASGCAARSSSASASVPGCRISTSTASVTRRQNPSRQVSL